MSEADWMVLLKTVAPLFGAAFAGIAAYFGALAAGQRGLRALEALIFAAGLVDSQARSLLSASSRNADDYEAARALAVGDLVSGLLRHVGVNDLPRHVPIRTLATIEQLATNQQTMLDRAYAGLASDADLVAHLSRTLGALRPEIELLGHEQAHLRRWFGWRWIYPTPWRKAVAAAAPKVAAP